VFYRIGAPALGPALFVELRVLLASGLLLAYLAGRGATGGTGRRLRERWREYLVLGAINAALPFTLIAIAELTLPASFASVLNATAPVFSTLLAVPLLGERLRLRPALGVIVGIVGVVVLVGAAPFPLTPVLVVSAMASLIAAFSYGLAAIYVRRALKGESPLDLTLGQQLSASLLLIPFALYELPTARFTPGAIGSVVGIAALSTALGYVIYFRILQVAGPTQALTVTFLIPVFGILWGSLLLGESIGLGLVLGAAIILVSIALVTDVRARAALKPPDSRAE
jgi:drug/metabolite transporter (DMT)-like permease